MGWVRIAATRGAWLAAGWCIAVASAQAAEPADIGSHFQNHRPSAEVRQTVNWAANSAAGAQDAQHKPFAIVDKKDARVFVFAAGGRFVGAAPALLGMAIGDDSAPGVGARVHTGIPVRERTTPAGRFESEPGHNLRGEAIVWVDYDAAIAIHRLRPAAAAERRPERLASDTPDDNRISLGCIVVSAAFYDAVVAPTLGRQRGVVYVLPETRSWQAEFGAALDAGL